MDYNGIMAFKPDDTICFCFHVPLRKIEAFCRIEKPTAASQISDCLSAGTGCGWCRPMLKKIHLRICGSHDPWWRQSPADNNSASNAAENSAAGLTHPPADDSRPGRTDDTDPAQYARGRRAYIAAGEGKPPEQA